MRIATTDGAHKLPDKVQRGGESGVEAQTKAVAELETEVKAAKLVQAGQTQCKWPKRVANANR